MKELCCNFRINRPIENSKSKFDSKNIFKAKKLTMNPNTITLEAEIPVSSYSFIL